MEPPAPEWWKPEMHAPWFHIAADGHIACDAWTDAPADRERWRIGNCFKTREQAEQAREQIREVFLHFHQHDA